MAKKGRKRVFDEYGVAHPNPVDIHVGKRLRQRRTVLGFSQEKLGEAVGLTFQQIQKYEHGLNRIGASRLFDFAEVLETDVNYFFDEMPTQVRAPRARGGVLREDQAPYRPSPDPLAKRETLELVRAYYKIRSPQIRKRLFELAKVLAGLTVGKDD